MSPRTLACHLLVLAALGDVAHAQLGGRNEGFAELALGWVRGDYRAPLVCEIDAAPVRGLRRLLIKPGPRHALDATNTIRFFDLEIPQGTACTSDTGAPQPNAVGSLSIGHDARARPDTARHDFTSHLRRKGELSFPIRAGSLRLGDPGREVDFSEGEARFRVVKPGSDAARRLADFGERRKLQLLLRAPDGTQLAVDLVQFGRR